MSTLREIIEKDPEEVTPEERALLFAEQREARAKFEELDKAGKIKGRKTPPKATPTPPPNTGEDEDNPFNVKVLG